MSERPKDGSGRGCVVASVLFVDGVILLAWQLRDPLHGPVVALKAFVRAVIAWSYS